MDFPSLYIAILALYTMIFCITTDDRSRFREVEMPLIKTFDYQGKERRIGNGKLRLSGADLRWIITSVLTIIVMGAVGWTTINAKVDENQSGLTNLKQCHKEDITGLGSKLDILVNLVQQQAVRQGKMEANIDHIQKNIEAIKEQ